MLCTLTASPTISPTVSLGLSDEYGSWNIIWKLGRIFLSASPFSFSMCFPSKIISPSVGSYSLSIVLPSVVFPQPDSPTIPTVLPLTSLSETPSTALRYTLFVLSKDFFIGKYSLRLFTSRRYSGSSVWVNVATSSAVTSVMIPFSIFVVTDSLSSAFTSSTISVFPLLFSVFFVKLSFFNTFSIMFIARYSLSVLS